MAASEESKVKVWEVNVGTWVRYDTETQELIEKAQSVGNPTVEYRARGQQYLVDLIAMQQINRRTGVQRAIRCIEVHEKADTSEECIQLPARSKRLCLLVERLLSPSVQIMLPVDAADEPARLNEKEVRSVFTHYVIDVESFLYRDTPGKFSLDFIVSAYGSGLTAFKDSAIHGHLLSLLRLIVHHGHAGKPMAASYLREVAEGFMDCQAVQGRVIERIGLEIRGVSYDFRGHLMKLVGDYKAMALKMLALERIVQRKVADSSTNPTHYENRLIADLGDMLGFNEDDIRLAHLDEHAVRRFVPLEADELTGAAERCRDLFDIEAVLQAFVSQVTAFNADSLATSLPRLLLDWGSVHMRQKHFLLDDATCSCTDVTQPLALAIFEMVFLGQLGAAPDETYREIPLDDVF